MAQFVTFVIPSGSSTGCVDITGQFDEEWGLMLYQGPSGNVRFGSITLTDSRLRIVIKDTIQANHRFNLRFSNTAHDTIHVENVHGNIQINDIQKADTPTAG